MFGSCASLGGLDVSDFRTDNVIDMSFMLVIYYSLKSLNISDFTANKESDISFMFFGCCSLKALNISNFNFNNAKRNYFIFGRLRDGNKELIQTEMTEK